MYLVLIETSGNQNYIFSTNKLKENIGASELTYRAGTIWVLEAVKRLRSTPESIHQLDLLLKDEITSQSSASDVRKKLLNEKAIESQNTEIEIIIATSGKALLLTQKRCVAKSIIRYVTHKALKYAPGLDVCGVFSEFEWGNNLSKAVKEVYQKHEEHRSFKSSPHLRFLRLPVFDECVTSGLPATDVDTKTADEKSVIRSSVSFSKREYGEKGRQRIENILKEYNIEFSFSNSIRALDEEEFDEDEGKNSKVRKLDWLAVIHADGNGLGEIFLNFQEYLDKLKTKEINLNVDRNYVNALRDFSIALDICNEKAFIKALTAFPKNEKGLIPIVPLVLGGDDLTVVCDGKSALDFTQKFLSNFEEETGKEQEVEDKKINIISEIAGGAFNVKPLSDCVGYNLNVKRLSACAGVAIIKPHFPFSVAYELAENLMQSAKEVKKIVKIQTTDENSDEDSKPYPCSALDFHVLYDSSAVDLEHIREKLILETLENGKTKLFARPYVVTSEENLLKATGEDWRKVHQWKSLQKRVKALTKKDENDSSKLNLPNSQIHGLREALFLGREAAEARYKLIRSRYINKGITELEFEDYPECLFSPEPKKDSEHETYITGLLDAIEAANFLK